jgi:hypothetical protein
MGFTMIFLLAHLGMWWWRKEVTLLHEFRAFVSRQAHAHVFAAFHGARKSTMHVVHNTIDHAWVRR